MPDQNRRWTIVGRVLLVSFATVVILTFFVVGLCAEENWRAKRNLSLCENELKARGENLDLASFIPPPVPDAANFAMAPLLAPVFRATGEEIAQKTKPRDPALERLAKVNVNVLMKAESKRARGLGDYETGRSIDLVEWQRYFQNDVQQNAAADQHEAGRVVLAWLTRWSSELEEFAAAANRRYARFPLDYSKSLAVPLPHLAFLQRFSIAYCLRANAALEAGDLDLAFRDLRTLDRTQAAISSEPLLISQLVRIIIIKLLLQVVWQGSVDHHWTNERLQEISEMLAESHLLVDYERVIRGERALSNDQYEKFRTRRNGIRSIVSEQLAWLNSPGGLSNWMLVVLPKNAVICRNQEWSERWAQDHVLPTVDALAHRIHPESQKEAERISREAKSTPYSFIAKIAAETYPSVTKRTATIQVALDQARLACALERFRLKTGQFPDTLDALIPDYVSAVPRDIINGEPLHYRRQSDGSYTLYSVGWNEVDDGGVIVKRSTDRSPRDNEQGDWVWLSSARK